MITIRQLVLMLTKYHSEEPEMNEIKAYEKLEMEMIFFESADIITNSQEDPYNGEKT